MQNILLQEMENFEGIMIATTNLTKNMDKAFERRLLCKIEFDKPDIEARSKIWSSMLPSLSKELCMKLSDRYDLSGGQLDNIARKYTADSILNQTDPSIDAIHLYCEIEFLYKNDRRRKVGYC